MGPPESPTTRRGNQPRRPKRIRRRPRARRCLLKGCEQCFRPRRAQQRYCSERCREAARRWSRWKAQKRYRSTTVGKQKRNGQSQELAGYVVGLKQHSRKLVTFALRQLPRLVREYPREPLVAAVREAATTVCMTWTVWSV